MTSLCDRMYVARREAMRRAGDALLARVPLTLAHYHDFGGDSSAVGTALRDDAGWDRLRATRGPFGVPRNRAELDARASDPGLVRRAATIADVSRRLGARTLASYGVGTAALELTLSRLAPELTIVCTEYAPGTIARLGELAPELDLQRHDLRSDWPIDSDLHLLHRVDTEFSDEELRGILSGFEQPALVVLTGYLDWERLRHERATRRVPTARRAGWVRTLPAIRRLFPPGRDAERLAVGDLTAFLLRPAQTD